MSDLIERYGYERAVRELKAMDDRAIWMISSCLKYREEVKKECLEYRRANNIFEVGDKVVLVDLRCSNDIWRVSESSTSDYVGVIKEGMLGFSVMHKSMTRHATELEIQAGRRL